MSLVQNPDVTRGRGRPARVFTTEVIQAIPRWVADGATRHDIARAIGTTVASLEVTCAIKGISLRADGGHGSLERTLARRLGTRRWAVLQVAAAARKVSTLQLVVRLLTATADSNLCDAVLDDRDEDRA